MVEWRYRIVQTYQKGAPVYALHVVYFEGDRIIDWEKAPEPFWGNTPEGLRADLLMAHFDSEEPILTAVDGYLV